MVFDFHKRFKKTRGSGVISQSLVIGRYASRIAWPLCWYVRWQWVLNVVSSLGLRVGKATLM